MLALFSFKDDFGLPAEPGGSSDSQNVEVSSTMVSLLTTGCYFGAIFAAFLDDYLGRRSSLIVLTVVLLIGVVLQVGASHPFSMI
ncbi:hypothetical protein BDV28DRAFT_138350 [Aspergillus coremiiformis]|uniref:Major facilitator superfamily (MFS) profile domain-containing protein n=1 Tax=Aspergillus coremiiformis TaxID=138285 RepID=A0A5N6Z1K1_9EURO|nr:hypothetical protein BDV28DRAFT_138350 [Aspergillus coremiiformis]